MGLTHHPTWITLLRGGGCAAGAPRPRSRTRTRLRWESVGGIGLNVDVFDASDPAAQDGPHLSRRSLQGWRRQRLRLALPLWFGTRKRGERALETANKPNVSFYRRRRTASASLLLTLRLTGSGLQRAVCFPRWASTSSESRADWLLPRRQRELGYCEGTARGGGNGGKEGVGACKDQIKDKVEAV